MSRSAGQSVVRFCPSQAARASMELAGVQRSIFILQAVRASLEGVPLIIKPRAVSDSQQAGA